MAEIRLVDTGFLSREREGTAVDVKVNNGTFIVLPSARLSLKQGANIEAEPHPGSGQDATGNYVSYENRRWDLHLTLKKTDPVHQTTLKHLGGIRGSTTYPGLARTEGVKVIYISGTNDTRKTSVELLGQVDTPFHGEEVDSGLPAFVVRAKTVSIEEDAQNGVWRVQCELKEV